MLALSACNPVDGVVQVAPGGDHTCALFDDGSVACWGNNASGQLGDGTTTNATAPVTVTGLTNVTSVTAGGSHTCATRSNNTVACWGNNASGQLGNGTTTNATTPVTASVTNATSVTAGSGHTCATRTNYTVACWGNNAAGQLGDGTTTNATTPVTVTGLIDPTDPTRVTSVTAGGSHTCATRSNNTVACWGNNAAGQLGDGTT
ncbi:MAG TPA: RCC1 repeat-containing protein, partial [Acidimicrobiales bacterium]|nr:RCC1 repeat-containing protein [Acidimicrobiales bacterium]